MCRAKCEHVEEAKQTSRSGRAKWRGSVGAARCSNDACLSLFDGKAERSEAQKKHNAAGERLCRKCAEEREKVTHESNNRKRKKEADTTHLKKRQVEEHRQAKQKRVVCADCTNLGFTARS